MEYPAPSWDFHENMVVSVAKKWDTENRNGIGGRLPYTESNTPEVDEIWNCSPGRSLRQERAYAHHGVVRPLG